ncbi:TOMM precursor leader peptide-binding protein [Lignipirellula cremea]|uniref:YcaO-like family protein n=1 Tax=Lignipirellula cremea TaxID=2528010 RepID=A0A518DQN3_9BACT|nr:TOMM precursor leader peptide-binding protein [Lignipirellula cremea]QDU94141.1 YcaO-like family protein [Lignipirellula cremea]
MLQFPVVRPYFHAEVVKDVGLFMVAEARQLVLQGSLYEKVVPLLDGRSVEEICLALRDEVAPAQVIFTIRNLERRGFLCEKSEAMPAGHAALWEVQGIEPTSVTPRLAQTPVSLTGFGVDVEPLAQLLGQLGVQIADDADHGVVLTNNYLQRGLREYNLESKRRGRRWMIAKPVGGVIWVGPVFLPGPEPCWQCLATRLRANSPVLGFLDAEMNGQGLPTIDRICTPASLATAWGIIASAVTDWIGRDASEQTHYENMMTTIDILDLGSDRHQLIRQPACIDCGDSTPAPEPPPLKLESRKKQYTDDGGHRASTPQETIAKYEHLVSSVCGAVSNLTRTSTREDDVMHVYVSGNNVARGPESIYSLRVDLRGQSAGKGMTEIQAKASALCEGLERYSGIYRGDEPVIHATFEEMGDRAIHPNDCMRFSDLQYAERIERNKIPSLFGTIPKVFEKDRKIDWSPVWSMSQQRYRYLPTQFCYFRYPHTEENDFSIDCSNGSAAGNTLEEAILQGFFEVVERDGVALWWYNRVQRPALDLGSFDIPYLRQLERFLAKQNRTLWALDLTTDLGFPVVAALSLRTDGKQQQIMFGFGAHLDVKIAMLRAVTELNQMLVTLIDTPPDTPPTVLNDVETLRWLTDARMEDHPYLAPLPGPARKSTDFPVIWTDDIREDVLFCQKTVESLGMEMHVLNQTRPEIGLPVIKVIVPGMRHFWTRFAPGRLYDTPVKLGWLEKPLTEQEINPIAMFL